MEYLYIFLFLLYLIFMVAYVIFSRFHKEVRMITEEDFGEEVDEKTLLRLKKLKSGSHNYQSVALMGMIFINMCLGLIFSAAYIALFVQFRKEIYVFLPWGNAVVNLIVALVFAVAIIIYFIINFTVGYLIPRRIVAGKKEGALGVVKIIGFFDVFVPLYKISSRLGNVILRLFGFKNLVADEEVTEDEIISMVNEGSAKGVIDSSEATMITNMLEFGDKKAKDIMTNRSNIFALEDTLTLDEAIEIMLGKQYSRFPVYNENLDHIIGTLNLKDALMYQASGRKKLGALKNYYSILRKPVYVPETRSVDVLFAKMQSEKIQMTIVLDEYGQTSGLIAFEDILEEIVGNIMDEYDIEEDFIKGKGLDEYEIDGLTPLEDLEKFLDIKFDIEDVDTLNGFLINKIEHIPTDDEKAELDYEGYHFKILEVENHIIQNVLVKRI